MTHHATPIASRARISTVIVASLLVARLVYSVASEAGIGWDFANYYLTGQRAYQGQTVDLYRLDANRMADFREWIGAAPQAPALAEAPRDQAESGRLGFIGFPLAAYLFAPLGLWSPRPALVAFKLASALCGVATGWLLWQPFSRLAARRLATGWTLPTYLTLCLFCEPFWFTFATGGQATAFTVLACVVFHHCLVRDQLTAAAAALVVAILVKPFFVLVLPLLLVAGEVRFLGRLAACGGLALGVSLALLGWPLHAEWFDVLRAAGGGLAEPWWNNSAALAAVYNVWCVVHHGSLATAGEPTGAIAWGIGLYKLAIILAFAALTHSAARSAATPAVRRHRVTMLAVLFALSFSSIVWPHYLMLLVLPLVYLLFPSPALPRPAAALVWLVTISLLAVQSRFAQRYILELCSAQPVLLAVLAGVFSSSTMLLCLLLLGVYPQAVVVAWSSPEGNPASPPSPGAGQHSGPSA